MDHGTTPSHLSQIAVLPGGDPGNSQGDHLAEEADGRPAPPRRQWLPAAVALAVAAVALVLWFLTARSDLADLRALPPPERAALVERTLSNLREICRGDERPRDFCRDQAALVLQLPECDQACRDEARAVLAADSAVK